MHYTYVEWLSLHERLPEKVRISCSIKVSFEVVHLQP